MNWLKTLTVALMFGSAASWIAWDVFLSSKGVQTESQLIAAAAHRSVALPFIVGFWMGHLFANRPGIGNSNWYNGLPIFLGLALFDVIWYATTKSEMTWFRYPALWLVAGLPVGSLLWGQTL